MSCLCVTDDNYIITQTREACITLFRSIIVFCGIVSISWNIPRYSHIQTVCGKYRGIFYGIMSVPHNIVMDLNNVICSLEDLLHPFHPLHKWNKLLQLAIFFLSRRITVQLTKIVPRNCEQASIPIHCIQFYTLICYNLHCTNLLGLEYSMSSVWE